MIKITTLLLALVMLPVSAIAGVVPSLPANMTGPQNPAPLRQAVNATLVTAHGNQSTITLRLDEIHYENYSLIIHYSLTQGEVLQAQGEHKDYLEQRFGSGENHYPDAQMLLHPDSFALITDVEEEYPLTADGFSPLDSDAFEYEPIPMYPGEELRFKIIFEFVESIEGAIIRFMDTGMYQVFMMRPDLMENSIAWQALE